MIRKLKNIAHYNIHNASHGGELSEGDLKILWVARTLTNIELQCEAELVRLEQSQINEEQRRFIREQLLSKFRERREPYVSLLEELRSRYRQSCAA